MRRSTRYITSSSAALAILFVVVGCWSSPPSSPPDTPTKPPEQPGEQAERALRMDAPFDLRFPEQTPPRRDVATKAVLAACRAGHHPSCWLLLQMATSQSALDVGFADAVSRCQKGDLWSCQAIPKLAADSLLPAGLPGARARGALPQWKPDGASQESRNDDRAGRVCIGQEGRGRRYLRGMCRVTLTRWPANDDSAVRRTVRA